MVRRAHDTLLDRPVAIKTVSGQTLGEEGRRRLLEEARAAARLNHPNIVSLYDAGESDGDAYLIMELVEGRSLHESPPESLEGLIAITRKVCLALDHAHSHGIVHRDLKPENILLGGDGRVKLLDFGLARPIATRLSADGGISGTVFYLAPEQAMGKAPRAQADLYSLGVILYELSTGRLPFTADDPLAVVTQHLYAPVVPPRTLRPDLPPALERLILRLLAKDPGGRPAQALEVERALAEIESVSARGDTDTADSLPIGQLARGRLIGRTAELGRLRQLWSEALAGRGVLALISGEPGVGKTRLARELVATARLAGASVLSGGCFEYEATTPYLPFVEALREWVRETSDERLQQVVETGAPEVIRMAPEVEDRLGPPEARPPLSPGEERLRLFDSLARVLQRMASPHGLLVFLDDLHWADSGSLQLLHYLLRHLQRDRVLFLAAYRETELDRTHPLAEAIVEWNRSRRAVRLALGRLSSDETATLLASLFQAETVSPEFAEAIQRETEGNPFFIEEVVNALIEGGMVYREEGRWERKAIEELAIPQSVKEAVGRRLNRLDSATLDVLHAAAVIGKSFSYGLLSASLNGNADDLLPALDQAAAAQLVAPAEGEAYAFTHDKIRETLYEEINPIRRRRLHQQVAEALERSPGSAARRRAQDLAYHFTAAGDSERGLEHSLQAAEQARALYAWDEAIGFLATARECALALERPDEVARLDALTAATYGDQGQFREAIAAYQRAIDATSDSIQALRLRIRLADMFTMIGDDQALGILKEVIGALDPQDQRLELATARAQLARHHHYAAEFGRTIELLDQARPVLEEAGDLPALTRTLAHYAGAYQHLARFDESEAWAQRLIRLGEDGGFTFAAAAGHEYLAENANLRGKFMQAADEARQDRLLGERIGSLDRVGWSGFSLAWALSGLGDLAAAEQMARESLEIADRIGDRRLIVWLAGLQVTILADLGRFDDARAQLEGIIERADGLRQVILQTHARYASGYLALQQGDAESAYRDLLEAERIAGATESRSALFLAGSLLAEACLAVGKLGEAEDAAPPPISKWSTTRAACGRKCALCVCWAELRWPGATCRRLSSRPNRRLPCTGTRADPIELGRTLVLRAAIRRTLGEARPPGLT